MHATKRHPPFWAISWLPRRSPAHLPGSTGKRVAVDIRGGPYIDLEREAQAMLARE
jgi:arylsulfatase